MGCTLSQEDFTNGSVFCRGRNNRVQAVAVSTTGHSNRIPLAWYASDDYIPSDADNGLTPPSQQPFIKPNDPIGAPPPPYTESAENGHVTVMRSPLPCNYERRDSSNQLDTTDGTLNLSIPMDMNERSTMELMVDHDGDRSPVGMATNNAQLTPEHISPDPLLSTAFRGYGGQNRALYPQTRTLRRQTQTQNLLHPQTQTLLPQTRTLHPQTQTLLPQTRNLRPLPETLFPPTRALYPPIQTLYPVLPPIQSTQQEPIAPWNTQATPLNTLSHTRDNELAAPRLTYDEMDDPTHLPLAPLIDRSASQVAIGSTSSMLQLPQPHPHIRRARKHKRKKQRKKTHHHRHGNHNATNTLDQSGNHGNTESEPTTSTELPSSIIDKQLETSTNGCLGDPVA